MSKTKELKNLVILYLDIIFLINFVFNLVLLMAAGGILQVRLSLIRVVLAASLGGIYAVLVTLPQFYLLANLLPKIIVSMLMAAVSLKYVNIHLYVRFWAMMFLVAFALGGAMLGLGYFNVALQAGEPIFLMELPGFSLTLAVLGVALALALGKNLISILRQSIFKKDFLIPLTISMGDKNTELVGLVDTGNHLRDPLTGNPVIIVEYQAMDDLLPTSLGAFLSSRYEPEMGELADIFGVEDWGKRLRLIPFASVGKEHGVMMGFKPDQVIIDNKGRKIIKNNIIIGLCQQALCPDNSYHALVNPKTVQ
jgi:stage II sporulation protein GA (sporulation sigma-E factor processing peptidase)